MKSDDRKARGSALRYDANAAEAFWTERLKSTDPLAAVLTYDAHPALNRAYDRWEIEILRSLLPKRGANKRALDIGCGIGRIAVTLAETGLTVTALDVSNAMLTACRKRAGRRGVASRMNYVHGSASDISGDRPLFDIITCFGLLEHLPEPQRRECLRLAFSRLKRRGRMFVVVNNSDNVLLKPKYPLKRQRDDGYYVGLVGMRWLQEVSARLGMTTKLCSANPFYALTHYLLMPRRDVLAMSEKECRRVCRLAGDLDLDHPLDGPLPDRLASHFMVEIRHRPRPGKGRTT